MSLTGWEVRTYKKRRHPAARDAGDVRVVLLAPGVVEELQRVGGALAVDQDLSGGRVEVRVRGGCREQRVGAGHDLAGLDQRRVRLELDGQLADVDVVERDRAVDLR